ncbi:hypothetical protein ACHWQZ_G006255 [Mnemiopsis leidyi]
MSETEDTGQQRDGDTEESDFDPDFKLEPLPRAADILAELPDYPDSEEEEQVRNIMQMITVKEDPNDIKAVVQENNSPKPDDGDLEENVVALENVAKKRAFSPIQSPVKARKPVETLPIESNSTASPTRKSKRQRIEAPKIVESKLEPKVYLNKAGEFVTGFDPTSKEAKYRRQMRMQRFGKYEKVEKSKLDESKLSNEDESEEEKPGRGPMFENRPEAIHLYGTDDLSTDDILQYFADYSPHHIEWIDDTHCNVVWSDVHSVKRALRSLSKKFTPEELEEKKAELRRREKDEDEFYLIPGTLDRPPKDEYEGIWRLAIKDDPKAHLLFMRFANTGDVKRRGAYKNSRYYSLYGNPNAPFLNQNNKYRKSKHNQRREPEEKKTNLEVKKSNERKPPDLRRHLNKGKIDVNRIKEEYKLGKPLIETLTIEVDRSEKSADVEVLKDDDSSENSSESEASSSDQQERTVEKRPVDKKQEKPQKKSVIVHSSSSEASSESSSESDSDSSGSSSSSSSDSSSSDSSDSSSSGIVYSSSDSSDSSSSDSSQEKQIKAKKKKLPKKTSVVVKRPPISTEKKKPKSKSVAVVRPIRSDPPKISSQIQTVHKSNGENRVRNKRRGRESMSPNIVKRPRVLQSNDLRAKLASRNR